MKRIEQNRKKILKEVSINGVKVKLELSKSEAIKFPRKLESTIKIKDKKLEPISANSIFL